MKYPLSGDDLLEIGKLVNRANRLLINKSTDESKLNGYSRATVESLQANVYRPDGDDVIGKLVEAPDGYWIGFEFAEEEE